MYAICVSAGMEWQRPKAHNANMPHAASRVIFILFLLFQRVNQLLEPNLVAHLASVVEISR